MQILKDYAVIRFVDFGFNMNLKNSRQYLRKMNNNFYEKPAYAVRAKFANLCAF